MKTRCSVNHRLTSLLGVCVLLITGCGGPDQGAASPGTDSAGAQTPDSTPTAQDEIVQTGSAAGADGPALSPEYLTGRWCYSHVDLGAGNREEQGVEYVFESGGKLAYQRNPGADTMDAGSYAIDGDMIDLRPMFMVFDLRIDEVEEDRLVLKGLGRHHFIRGACPE